MIISTWNVNSCNKRADQIKVIAENIDLMMIQELKSETFSVNLKGNLYVEYVGQKQFNGVATMSKHPIKVINESIDEQARFLEVECRGIRFINIYAPNGNPVGSDKFEYKLQWTDRLIEILHNRICNNIPTVIAGDFNIIPTDDCCYDPKAWIGDAVFHPESRKRFFQILGLGYTDIYMLFHDKPEFTYWGYKGGAWYKNHGVRIDHILACPIAVDMCKSSEILKHIRANKSPSDHVPVNASISLVE